MAVTRHLPANRTTRLAELFFALVAIGSHVLFWSLAAVPEWASHESVLPMVGYGAHILFFGSPLVLALAVFLHSAVDDIGVGSVLAVGLALLTVYVVGISVYTLVDPPEGGGVYFGHILSSMVVVPFVAVVLLRRALDRLFDHLWHHYGETIHHRS